jgi:LEA14-like dessication related protein
MARSVEAPEVEMISLAALSAGGQGQRFRVGLLVRNTNPAPLAVRSLTFQVRLGTEGRLRGETAVPFTVPPLGEETLRLEVETELVSSLSRLLALVQGPNDALAYELDGEIEAAGAMRRTLTFYHEGEVPLSATMGGL